VIGLKSVLAIIPARSGSKRLPNKNILDLVDKPLIAWSIEAGIKSKYIDKVVVSSDSDEILNLSKKFGASTIKRPKELANDTATSFDAVRHAIDNIKDVFDYVVLLQPTSPLRNVNHIDEAFELLNRKKADAVISVTDVDHSPLNSNTLPKDGSMINFIKKNILEKRSQDIERYYHLNGALYICKIERLLEESTFFIKDQIFAYKMNRECSVDIDEGIDFKLAEVLLTIPANH
jgi:CMP-N,N'-diacetyllegionaminic acid synthase